MSRPGLLIYGFRMDRLTKGQQTRRVHVGRSEKHVPTGKEADVADMNRDRCKFSGELLHFRLYFRLFLQRERSKGDMIRNIGRLCSFETGLYQTLIPAGHPFLRVVTQIR